MESMKISKPTVTSTVRRVFERMADNVEFSGIEFKKLCVKENPELKNVYEDTFMRILRKYYRSRFVCVNRIKSIYRKQTA